MPRQARQSSASKYQHIIIRGIGKQVLFEERKDYLYFLSKLKDYCAETQVKVCSYCLKRNKVIQHLKREGLKTRQIERLTGISRGVIQNIKM